jgi:uncharacterized protein
MGQGFVLSPFLAHGRNVTASLSTKAGMKLSEPYRFFAVLRQSVSAEAGYSVEPLRRLSKRAALPFDWDERKNKSNRNKHGVWFEEAQSVFSDPYGRLFYDPEHSERADRFILLGVSSAARTLVVVHCYRENEFRGQDYFCP